MCGEIFGRLGRKDLFRHLHDRGIANLYEHPRFLRDPTASRCLVGRLPGLRFKLIPPLPPVRSPPACAAFAASHDLMECLVRPNAVKHLTLEGCAEMEGSTPPEDEELTALTLRAPRTASNEGKKVMALQLEGLREVGRIAGSPSPELLPHDRFTMTTMGEASFPRRAGYSDRMSRDCTLHEHDSVPHNCHDTTTIDTTTAMVPHCHDDASGEIKLRARGQGAVCASLHGTEADHPECSGRHRVDGPNGCQNAECKGRGFCVRSCSGCPDAKSARETRARLDLCERYYKERLVPLPASDELKAQW